MIKNPFSFTQIEGRVATEPELKETQQGKQLLKFVLAYDGVHLTDSENSHTSFIDVAMWGKSAELFYRHIFKGLKVLVHGDVLQRRYTDKDGNKRHNFQMNGVTMVITDPEFQPKDRSKEEDREVQKAA